MHEYRRARRWRRSHRLDARPTNSDAVGSASQSSIGTAARRSRREPWRYMRARGRSMRSWRSPGPCRGVCHAVLPRSRAPVPYRFADRNRLARERPGGNAPGRSAHGPSGGGPLPMGPAEIPIRYEGRRPVRTARRHALQPDRRRTAFAAAGRALCDRRVGCACRHRRPGKQRGAGAGGNHATLLLRAAARRIHRAHRRPPDGAGHRALLRRARHPLAGGEVSIRCAGVRVGADTGVKRLMRVAANGARALPYAVTVCASIKGADHTS